MNSAMRASSARNSRTIPARQGGQEDNYHSGKDSWDGNIPRQSPEFNTIPHFLVEAVVEAPNGARPGICFGEYEIG